MAMSRLVPLLEFNQEWADFFTSQHRMVETDTGGLVGGIEAALRNEAPSLDSGEKQLQRQAQRT